MSTGGRKLFWGMAAVVAGCAAWRLPPLAIRDGEAQPKLKASSTPLPQRQRERTWRAVEWERVATLGATEGLGAPAFMRPGPQDSVTVLDGSSYTITKLSPAGKIVARFGIPDHVLRASTIPLTDMTSSEDGTTWVCNPNGRVVGFLSDGRIRYTLPDTAHAFKAVIVKDRLVLMLTPTSNQLFAIYTPEGRVVRTFGEFLEGQQRVGIVLAGSLTADTVAESIFFAPAYGGFLASYNLDGTRRFLVQTVDAPPPPKLQRTKSGGLKYQRLTTLQLSSLNVFEDNVYALVSLSGGPGGGRTVLDVYSERDGSYLHSIALPERCNGVALGRGFLHTGSAKGVTVWGQVSGSPSRPAAGGGTSLDTAPTQQYFPRARRKGLTVDRLTAIIPTSGWAQRGRNHGTKSGCIPGEKIQRFDPRTAPSCVAIPGFAAEAALRGRCLEGTR